MSDPNLFVDPNSQETPAKPEAPTEGNMFSDQLSQITNENGAPKYDDVGKALEALKHSQNYIPEIKGQLEAKDAELVALKAELEKRESVEDVVKRLTERQQTPPVETPQATGLGQDDVVGLVQKVLQQNSQENVLATNMQEVLTTMQTKFGDKAQEVISSKAAELGTQPSELQKMAQSNPKVFLALFPEIKQSGGPTTNSYRSQTPDGKPYQAEAPNKSVLVGATSADQASHWADIRKEVYGKHDITE